MQIQQKHYDATNRRAAERKAQAGGCFAPAGSVCDETHCECSQIAFDEVITEALATQPARRA